MSYDATATAMPPTQGNKVRLEIYASKLPNLAGAFKGTSDPFAIVTVLANNPGDKPRIIGKTEVYVTATLVSAVCQ